MDSEPEKKSSRLAEFIARVYDVYFPGHHGYNGTDADQSAVTAGTDFASHSSDGDQRGQQDPASGDIDAGQTAMSESSDF